MADGQYRGHFSAGSGPQQYFNPHNQLNQQLHQAFRGSSPVNNGRPVYANDTPSPSRSPISQAPANPFHMFNINQQGGSSMMSGGGQRGFVSMSAGQKHQHNTHQQHHGHTTHHQQHGGHAGQGGFSHQHTISGGLQSINQGYSTNGLQHNSLTDDETDMLDHHPEHWRRQIEACNIGRENSGRPQWHSKERTAAQYSQRAVAQADDNEEDGAEGNRALLLAGERRQEWDGMDMSGQALRALNARLGTMYSFLTRLYLDNNKLTLLPLELGQLRSLKILNVSNNQLTGLPRCIGMLSNLVELSLFDNQITVLPNEIGFLYKLDQLGLVGNPLQDGSIDILKMHDTKYLVKLLRDGSEGGLLFYSSSIVVF